MRLKDCVKYGSVSMSNLTMLNEVFNKNVCQCVKALKRNSL